MRTKLQSDQHGATLVEFAIIILTVLLMLGGTIELGIGIYHYNRVNFLTNESVREASASSYAIPPSRWACNFAAQNALNAATKRVPPMSITGRSILVIGTPLPVPPNSYTFNETAIRNPPGQSDLISLTTTFHYQCLFCKLFGVDYIDISSTALGVSQRKCA